MAEAKPKKYSYFEADYAKSDRSTCRLCKELIKRPALRLAILLKSSKYDGQIATWYHYDCFFKKTMPKKESQIRGFDSLRWEDQQKIKKSMGLVTGSDADDSKNQAVNDEEESNADKKEEKPSSSVKKATIDKFGVELTKTGRCKCKDCKKPIAKDTIRISKKEWVKGYKRDFGFHLECFDGPKAGLQLTVNPEDIPGFDKLDEDSQKLMKKRFGTQEEKVEAEVATTSKPTMKGRKRKSENKDKVVEEKKLKSNESDESEKDKELREQNDLFWKYKDEVGNKMSKEVMKNLILHNKQELTRTGNADLVTTLADYLCFGALEPCPECKGQLTYNALYYYCTGNQTAWTKCTYKTQEPKRIPFEISEECLKVCPFLKNYKYTPRKRIFAKELQHDDDTVTKKPQKQRVRKPKASDTTVKMKVKGGAAVDPDSGLENEAHVVKETDTTGDPFSVVLGLVDIQRGTNSFYKIQVLEHDTKPTKYLFRSWGRVGTKIGSHKLEEFSTLSRAISEFKSIYEDKTGNTWSHRKNFIKKPTKFYPLDVDYGTEDSDITDKLIDPNKIGLTSKLEKPVQNLVRLIFDIEKFKDTLMEFEIDLNKMPLGKLSSNQLKKAYGVLNELTDILDKGSNKNLILDASNRFYTLVPHDFGIKRPQLLNNHEIIKSKLEMINNLLDIEIAYNLIKTSNDDEVDPIDQHYEKLKCKINTLDQNCDEYKLIVKYLESTQKGSYKSCKIVVEDIFTIEREGEVERYKTFANLHNKKLLWHGSRVTNFAGILSQGLRIAPPEAPVSGYRLGKGIYLADMICKSADYCATSRDNPTALVLLVEVALGDEYQLTHDEHLSKPPTGKHSTRGCGITAPDPKDTVKIENDIEVPIGQGISSSSKSSFSFNEFVVYDVAQVKLRYLLRLKFDYGK